MAGRPGGRRPGRNPPLVPGALGGRGAPTRPGKPQAEELQMSRRIKLVAGCVTALALVLPAAAGATTGTFTNNTPVAIPDGGSAPASNVVVSGLPGLTNDVNVTLTNASHKRITDLDALLVAPNGAGSVVLLSDAGDAT